MVCGDVPALRMRAVGLEGARGEGGFRARARPGRGGPTWDLEGRRGDQLELEHPRHVSPRRGANPALRTPRGSRAVLLGSGFPEKGGLFPHLLRGSSSGTLQETLGSPAKAKAGPFV